MKAKSSYKLLSMFIVALFILFTACSDETAFKSSATTTSDTIKCH